ncbi:MAG TPA: bifunctional serine/threonine-protein kinase/ABC transporter substrate-binding protein, partial [Pyrinomonadaceae bacterium]
MIGLERFIGEVLDGKYLLERLLGQGGMGAVCLAIHLGTERPVALKLIAPEFMRNDEFVERFKREARAAGRLRHPNVVDVTDFGFAQVGDERVAYLVMEYLDGCSLGDVLSEESRLPLDWVVDILEQICSAVDDAHHQGIVHRDLKPDNIWLEPTRLGGYRVKVLDFGIAKLAEASATNTDSLAEGEGAKDLMLTQSAAQGSGRSQLDDVQNAITRAASSLQRSRANKPQVEDAAEAGTRLFEAGTQIFSERAEEQQTRILPPTEKMSHSQNESAATAAAPRLAEEDNG